MERNFPVIRKSKRDIQRVPPELRLRILERDEWTCAYCKCELPRTRKAQVDHIMPHSRGGLTIETNLVACCQRCNGKKRHRMDFSPHIPKPRFKRRKR